MTGTHPAADPSLRLALEGRLNAIPSTASIRGFFFNMIADDLARRNLSQEARRVVGPRRKVHALYPVKELLVAMAAAAPLVDSDPDRAMRHFFSSGAHYFASTWFGKTFQRFIRPDPASALHWVESGREHFANYGRWRLELVAPTHAIMHMFDEYIWIDSAHRGGCEGMLVACGVTGEVEATLDSPFQGRLDIRWQPHN